MQTPTYSTSGDYNKKYGLSEAERMDQKAISNISYSKRWPKTKNSFSANYYSNIDLLVSDKTNPMSNYFITPSGEGTQINIGNKHSPNFHSGTAKVIFPLRVQRTKMV